MCLLTFILVHFIETQSTKTWHIHKHTYTITSSFKRILLLLLLHYTYTNTNTMTLDILKMTITMIMCSAFFSCSSKGSSLLFKEKKTIKALKHKVQWSRYYRFLLSLLLILNKNNRKKTLSESTWILSVFFSRINGNI